MLNLTIKLAYSNKTLKYSNQGEGVHFKLTQICNMLAPLWSGLPLASVAESMSEILRRP